MRAASIPRSLKQLRSARGLRRSAAASSAVPRGGGCPFHPAPSRPRAAAGFHSSPRSARAPPCSAIRSSRDRRASTRSTTGIRARASAPIRRAARSTSGTRCASCGSDERSRRVIEALLAAIHCRHDTACAVTETGRSGIGRVRVPAPNVKATGSHADRHRVETTRSLPAALNRSARGHLSSRFSA
jgi:hypothetical protein